jgi:hypothetical protein
MNGLRTLPQPFILTARRWAVLRFDHLAVIAVCARAEPSSMKLLVLGRAYFVAVARCSREDSNTDYAKAGMAQRHATNRHNHMKDGRGRITLFSGGSS